MMMPLAPLPFDGSSMLLKEIQNAISFCCYSNMFQQDSMTISEQHNYVYKLYHGDGSPETISFVDQALAGLGMFRGLFDMAEESTLQVVNQNASTSHALVLKPYLHSQHIPIKVGVMKGDLNKQLLRTHTLSD